jgi:ion channel
VNGRPSPEAAARRVPRTERSRLRRLRASHSYALVLALVVASFLFALVAPDEPWTASVLVAVQGVTLAIALWTSGITRAHRTRDAAIAGAAAVTAVLNIVPGGTAAAAATALFAVVLTIAIGAVIGLGVVDQGEVNRNSVRGAIAVYIVLGLIFSFAYAAVATLGDGGFFSNGTDGTRALRTYFSYVTLATLGYGDYTAAGTLGHALSVTEALLGQLYLVTVVAVLVARLGHRRRPVEDDEQALIPPG